MKTLELNNVILDIKTILTHNPAQIRRVGVFGSLAKGKIHNDSDIDIAIEYETGENLDKYNFDSFVTFCETCEILSKGMSKMYRRKIDVVQVEEKQGGFLDDIRDEVVWI